MAKAGKVTVKVTCKGSGTADIAELHPFQGDLKSVSVEAFKKLRGLIIKQGFSFPVFVWRDNKGKLCLIDGHARLATLKKMREAGDLIPTIPYAEVKAESYVEAKQKLLAASSGFGKIEGQGLYEFLHEAELDFSFLADNIDFQGFDLDKFGVEFFKDTGSGTEGLTDPDDVPDSVPPRCRTGDLWILGNHRLLCGDATILQDALRLMNGTTADCVWTDPPYNVAYEGKTKDALTIQNDKMDDLSFRQFLARAFATMAEVTKKGGAIYVAHADTEGYNFRGALVETGWLLKQCLIWVKSCLVMGRQDYQWKHEPILYGWREGASHKWFSDRKQTTVLEFDKPTRSAEHPTMKPVELVIYCIKNSSKSGDVVLDLFGGSGTTMIACEKLGRLSRIMEIDPRYCDVILARWEQFTGKTATFVGATSGPRKIKKKQKRKTAAKRPRHTRKSASHQGAHAPT